MTRESADTGAQREQLSAWLDGELTEAEAAELEAELARDPALRAELEELETVVRLLREEGPTQAPLGFHHRVMARIEQEHPPRRSAWAWLRRPFGIPLEGWAIGLAAALALLLVLPKGEAPVHPPAPAPEQESPAATKAAAEEVEPAPPVADAAADDDAVAQVELPPEKAPPRKGAEKKLDLAPVPSPVVIPGVATTGEPQPGPPPATPDAAAKPAPAASPEGTAQADPTAYQLIVRTTDVSKKREILRVMAQFGGARDAAGAFVTKPEPQASRELLVVDVPASQLGEFWKRLDDLHLPIVGRTDPTGIVSGDTVRVIVRLEIEGGAPQSAPPPVNRAQADEDDVLEAL